MSQIFISAKDDTQLGKITKIFRKNNFKLDLAKGERRFMPILVDFREKLVRSLTSATICNCMFNLAKKPLLNFNDFENILYLIKE